MIASRTDPRTGRVSHPLPYYIIYGFTYPLRAEQRPATFFRNNSELSANDFVSLKNVSDEDAVEIVFTAEQEGEFFCRTALGEMSSILYLAGVSSLQ